MEVMTFTCSICGEVSTDICVYCTKDSCANHLCRRCHRCSDCCECELRLDEQEHSSDERFQSGLHLNSLKPETETKIPGLSDEESTLPNPE